ncbi:MAG TPA: chromate efflux transporter [Phenylobacterium sp.]|nr:chromate efflux transporter [Phenylobacterium sp.]
MGGEADPTATAGRPSLAALTGASWKVGVLGFGGPAGQIALMHRVFIDEKRWIDEAHFLRALSFCTLLPGPEAQQLATYLGWLLHGVRGGLIAGLLFVLPGVAVMLGLSWLYAAHGTIPWVAAIFYGVKAAVLGLVAEALVRIGRRALKGWADVAVAAAALAAIGVFGVPFPLVVLAAGLAGLMRPSGAEPSRGEAPRAGRALATAAAWGALWLAPLAGLWLTLGPRHLLTEVAALFSGLAAVSFGGAYAALAYLQQQAVATHGWLTAAQMIDGLGLAETTPGPLVLVNQHVAFMAGWQAPGGGAGLAVAAALLASWSTFAPSFLWIFAGAPFAERFGARARGALVTVTAAVLGVIANLGLWFAIHALFARSWTWRAPGGHAVDLPQLASLDPLAAALALAAGVALIRWHAPVIAVVLGCAAAGVVVRLGF